MEQLNNPYGHLDYKHYITAKQGLLNMKPIHTWVMIEDLSGLIFDVQAFPVSIAPSGEAAFSGRGGKASL